MRKTKWGIRKLVLERLLFAIGDACNAYQDAVTDAGEKRAIMAISELSKSFAEVWKGGRRGPLEGGEE